MLSIGKSKQIVALNPATDSVVISELVVAGRVLAKEVGRLEDENGLMLSRLRALGSTLPAELDRAAEVANAKEPE